MIALSECGYSGGTSPYMTDQWAAGAKWSFGMPWYHYQYTMGGNHQYANDDWWQAWFDDDKTLTMEEMRVLRRQYLGETGIEDVSADDAPLSDSWYTLQGVRVNRPTTPGIYIHNGKKVAVR